MSDKSSIEWTDATWNPVRGCALVSPGCTNCYAMKTAHRFSGAGQAYEGLTKMSKGGPVWTGKIRALPEMLGRPGLWKKPRRIFVNSMSDLFHEDVPDSFIADVWLRMAWNQKHIFQILTKRPRRMLDWLCGEGADAVFAGERPEYEDSIRRHGWPLRNVWLGVSVEDQVRADERIPLLLQTPAAVRWISAEPLLGPISFEGCWIEYKNPAIHENWLERLNWVVVGGESGPDARPMHPDWARSLRDQCAAVGVPFFFKQWGAFLPGELAKGDVSISWQDGRREWYGDHQDIKYSENWLTNDERGLVLAWPAGKKAAGRLLDGRTHDEYPTQ